MRINGRRSKSAADRTEASAAQTESTTIPIRASASEIGSRMQVRECSPDRRCLGSRGPSGHRIQPGPWRRGPSIAHRCHGLPGATPLHFRPTAPHAGTGAFQSGCSLPTPSQCMADPRGRGTNTASRTIRISPGLLWVGPSVLGTRAHSFLRTTRGLRLRMARVGHVPGA